MPQIAKSKRRLTQTLLRNTFGPGQTTQIHHESKTILQIHVHSLRPPYPTMKISGPLWTRSTANAHALTLDRH